MLLGSNCHPARTCPTENKCRRAIPAFPVEKDMSQDFLDLSNTYFFADSLVSFDTSTGRGLSVETPATDARQAFQIPTCLTSPLQSLDFPGDGLRQQSQLTFTVELVSERTSASVCLPRPSYRNPMPMTPMLIGKACRRTLLLEKPRRRIKVPFCTPPDTAAC